MRKAVEMVIGIRCSTAELVNGRVDKGEWKAISACLGLWLGCEQLVRWEW